MSKRGKFTNTALRIAVIAMFAAILVAGKIALSGLPNIEIVTLVIALCGFVWGFSVAIPATEIFVTAQLLQYSFHTWVIYYYLHWTVVAVLFSLLGKLRYRNNGVKLAVVSVSAVVMTFLFGVLTTFVDTLLGYSYDRGFWVVTQDFFSRYAIMYARGLVFFIIHIACNAVLFPVAFLPLEKVMRKAKRGIFDEA